MKTKSNQNQPINFMRLTPVYLAISLLVIIPGAISLIRFGLKPAIDFTGGSLIELALPENQVPAEEMVRASLPNGIEIASMQTTSTNSVIIRTSPVTNEQKELLKVELASRSGLLTASNSGMINPASLITEVRYETVGPTLGRELLQKTFMAIALASIVITLFVASRFKEFKFGISAIVAVFHDTMVVLGVFSLLGHYFGVQVDTLFVTAVLTTLSFSVHDTIVVYDRIRESRKLNPSADFIDLVNKAVTETLSRSINNSMTIIFMLLSLFLLGGETTKWFAFALLIGTITGTYSSTFTAAPILTLIEKFTHRRRLK